MALSFSWPASYQITGYFLSEAFIFSSINLKYNAFFLRLFTFCSTQIVQLSGVQIYASKNQIFYPLSFIFLDYPYKTEYWNSKTFFEPQILGTIYVHNVENLEKYYVVFWIN